MLTYSTIVFLPGSTLELVEASEVLVQVADAGQAAVLAAASSPPPTWVADTAVVWNLPAPASVVISPAAGLTLNGGVTLSLG